MEKAKVYFTKDISSDGLIKIYEALGVELTGNIGIKVSTGERGSKGYLKASLIKPLVDKLNGTIIECNTAYPGARNDAIEHMQVAKEHGFVDMGQGVEIMDGIGEFKIPTRENSKHLKYDLIGEGFKKYDSILNLAHGKGHAMGGFGANLKTNLLVLHLVMEKPTFIAVVKLKILINVGLQNMNKKTLSNQWLKQQQQLLIT